MKENGHSILCNIAEGASAFCCYFAMVVCGGLLHLSLRLTERKCNKSPVRNFQGHEPENSLSGRDFLGGIFSAHHLLAHGSLLLPGRLAVIDLRAPAIFMGIITAGLLWAAWLDC